MTGAVSAFWEKFHDQHFEQAQVELEALSSGDKQSILAELYQKSSFHQKPVLVSVLRRQPQDGKGFDDFYKSWFPPEDACNRIESRGQVFQQFFPAPVRVINGTNIDGSNDIVSVGITWVKNEEEEAELWDYLSKAEAGEDENNEARRDNIEEVADGGLVGIYKIETDDNLGTPFT